MTEFIPFPKIPRLCRDMVVTEKIDGTNASIWIEDRTIKAASRNRFITRDKDNYGFARWVWYHGLELIEGLGEGTHYGEWWGQGIQRNYDLDTKRFSLFNVDRWTDERPECCDVVPILYRGPFNVEMVHCMLVDLRETGSYAAPGFDNPEGVCVYHSHARSLFKVTIGDDGHKNIKKDVRHAQT